MSLELELIADLSLIMIVAAGVTFIFHKLKQPLILGYLLAGIIVGPYTTPFLFIHRLDVVEATGNLGMILLLFSIGLEFPIAKFRTMKLRVYLGISIIEIAVMFLISYGIGLVFDLSLVDSFFLGTALASSSTVIIAKVLGDLGELHEESSLIMMSVLVTEDLVVVLILSILTSVVGQGASSFVIISWTLGKALLFLVITSLVGIFIIPKAVDWISRPDIKVKWISRPKIELKAEPEIQNEHDELLILESLGICFALSLIGNSVGLSVAIGAFLAGVFIASSKSASRVAVLTYPIKDMFAAIFFVSMGAMIDVTQFRAFLIPALVITVLMIIGKTVGCGLGTKLFGYDAKTALKVGFGMGQIGEFGLIVVQAGQSLGVISSFLFSTIGVAVGLSSFISPYMIRYSNKIELTRLPPFLKRFLK